MTTVKTEPEEQATSVPPNEEANVNNEANVNDENAPIDKDEWAAFCDEIKDIDRILEYDMLEDIIDGIRRGHKLAGKQLHEPPELLAAIFKNVVTTRMDVTEAFKKFHEEPNALFIYLKDERRNFKRERELWMEDWRRTGQALHVLTEETKDIIRSLEELREELKQQKKLVQEMKFEQKNIDAHATDVKTVVSEDAEGELTLQELKFRS